MLEKISSQLDQYNGGVTSEPMPVFQASFFETVATAKKIEADTFFTSKMNFA